MNEHEKNPAIQLGNVILKADRLEKLGTELARKIRSLEIATNELADRLAKMEANDGGPLWQARMSDMQKRIGEIEQENIAIRERLAALELRPQPCPLPHPYPVHPGWIPQPGVIPGTPWYVPPDAKFMGMYYTTQESTQ